jgi:hypothetical protein
MGGSCNLYWLAHEGCVKLYIFLIFGTNFCCSFRIDLLGFILSDWKRTNRSHQMRIMPSDGAIKWYFPQTEYCGLCLLPLLCGRYPWRLVRKDHLMWLGSVVGGACYCYLLKLIFVAKHEGKNWRLEKNVRSRARRVLLVLCTSPRRL